MKASSGHKNTNGTGPESNRGRGLPSGNAKFLPTLVALGGSCALAAVPAGALELGEVRVESTLGQPLRASIAYALNPGEQIFGHCVLLRSRPTGNGLPAIRDARIRVAEGAIRLSGAPVTEPLVGVRLNVDCPDVARLARDYTMFIDPPSTDLAAAPVSAADRAPAVTTGTRGTSEAASPPPRSAPPPVRDPVASAGEYRVQSGDTLSGIAERISGRTMGLWQTVDTLFAANPQAFIGGNRDRLLAGALLDIPASVLAEPAAGVRVQAREPAPETAAASVPFSETTPAEPAGPSPAAAVERSGAQTAERQATPDTATNARSSETAPAEPARPSPAATVERSGARTAEPRAAPDTAAASSTPRSAAPRQGDVALEADGPFVSPIEPREAVVDPQAEATGTGLQEPTAESGTRRAPLASATPAGGSRAWLMWLGGSGIALILALLLFGRQLKDRFAPAAVSGTFDRRKPGAPGPDDTTTVAAAVADLDTRGDGHDADPDDGGEIDLAQDFGYSPGEFNDSGDLPEPSRSIPADRFGETAILENEILPSDETGEHDLSMIVEATHEPLAETDATAGDPSAIQPDGDDEASEAAADSTISNEIDYKILEQDYEDEFSATQALNAELAKAASELTLQNDDDKTSQMATVDDEATSHLPIDAMLEEGDDATAVLPGEADADSAGASTVETEPESAADDDTANTPADTVEGSNISEGMASGTTDAENDDAATAESKRRKVS